MKTKQSTSIKLPPDLLQWITEHSDATGVSVSGLIGMYIYEKREAERAKQ